MYVPLSVLLAVRIIAGLGPAPKIGPLIDFFFFFIVGDQFICTGTLVEPDLVVTSASCTLRMFETGVG